MTLQTAPGLALHQCHSMAEVRAHIDALDAAIVPLIAQRSGYVAQAARIKQHASQIVDLERVEYIVQRVQAQAEALGAPAGVVEATYRAMIAASIVFEQREFARLRASDAPDAPDGGGEAS